MHAAAHHLLSLTLFTLKSTVQGPNFTVLNSGKDTTTASAI